MKDPVFSIHIGQNSADCRISCNGHDITRAIRKIVFTTEAASLSTLELTAAYGSAAADIHAAIASVTVVVPTAETTALADEYETCSVVQK
jgi:hypothetical protein